MRYLMRFSYDGSNFFGYQKQKDKRTIQGEIEDALSKIAKQKIVISASGRTDALVHAINQYAHFDLDINIEPENLKKAINSLVSDDIYVKNIKVVPNNFHARFDVQKKEYIYKINLGEYNPLMRNYVYQYNKPLDIEKMRLAIQFFVGKHDFKSFTKTTDEIKDYVREIIAADIVLENNVVIIRFLGTGFLRYMVRNMVGTLISVGEGTLKPEDIEYILACCDRTKAKKTAVANGLYLNNVYYE